MKNILTFLLLSFSAILSFAENIEPRRHDTILGKELVYTADQIDSILANFQAKSEIITNRYPMFILELNSDIAILENSVVKYDYTDYLSFELKATTNNFFNEGFAWTNKLNGTTRIIPGMPDLDRTLFWASCYDVYNRNPSYNECMRTFAADANANTLAQSIKNPGDARTLYRFENMFNNQYYSNKNGSIPKYVVVIIDYAALLKRDKEKAKWLHDKNDNITWHFTRFSLSSAEKGWNPCYPIRWFNKMPSWACYNGEIRN